MLGGDEGERRVRVRGRGCIGISSVTWLCVKMYFKYIIGNTLHETFNPITF